MPSKAVMDAALATSSTYEGRDDAGKAQYVARVQRLVEAIEPIIQEEARQPPSQKGSLYERVWEAIKPWDIERSEGEGYASANGTDVLTILAAVGEPIVNDQQIREIAGQAAGAASGVFLRLHPDEVMPSEEVAAEVDRVLESFGIKARSVAETHDGPCPTDDDVQPSLRPGQRYRVAAVDAYGMPTELTMTGEYGRWPRVGEVLAPAPRIG